MTTSPKQYANGYYYLAVKLSTTKTLTVDQFKEQYKANSLNEDAEKVFDEIVDSLLTSTLINTYLYKNRFDLGIKIYDEGLDIKYKNSSDSAMKGYLDLYQGTVDAYKLVCQEYIDYYKYIVENGSGSAWGTVALIDSKEVGTLTQEIKNEITLHKADLSDYDPNVLQEYGRNGGPYISYDMGHFIKDLNDGVIPTSFDAQLQKTVIYKDCLETARSGGFGDYSVDVENYSGLGIYIPTSKRPKWNQYFKTLDWYHVSGCNEVTFSWNF